MKKQILFLLVFIMSLFLAGTKSYGQVTYTKVLTGDPVNATAVPLTCAADNELNPIPGKKYDYSVTIPAGSKVKWFVTTSTKVIDINAGAPVLASANDVGDGSGSYILTSGATYNTLSTTSTIKISWKAFDGVTTPVILVAYVEDASTCAINNVQIYRIVPSFNFTLDMVALLDDGTQGNTECISNIESATYTPGAAGAPGTMKMNYGENWVYFSVTAANFVHSWMPTFTVTGYTGAAGTAGVPVADIQWAYADKAKSTTATDWHAATSPVLAQVAGGAVGAAGESIVVRVRIVHGVNEDAGVLTFGVDGTMYDPATTLYATTTMKDLDAPVAPAVTCDNTKTDTQTYTLTPRPTVTSATGTGPSPFVPKN